WSSGGNPDGTLFTAERSTDGAVFSAFYSGVSLSTTASGLLSGIPYFFRVRANNGNAFATAYDAVISTATPPSAPAAPSVPTVSTRTTTSLTWTWTDRSHNEDGFRVLRATDALV